MDRIYNLDAILAAAEAQREENEALRAEVEGLRGQLTEARRENRALRRGWARAEGRSARDLAFWRHLIAAAVGVSVALVCLLHSIVIAGVMAG